MNTKLIEKLLCMLVNTKEDKEDTSDIDTEYTVGDYILLRSYYTGVIFGKFMGYSEKGIILHDSRRLRLWKAVKGISISEVAKYGLKSDSKVTDAVNIEITDPTVCEMIKCSKECIKTINAIDPYQP